MGISLDAEATDWLWLNLSLDEEDLLSDQKEKLIQKAWDRQINRPEYNSWRRYYRNFGRTKAREGEDDADYEPLMSEAAYDRIFRKDEIERKRQILGRIVSFLDLPYNCRKIDIGSFYYNQEDRKCRLLANNVFLCRSRSGLSPNAAGAA